MQTPSDIRAKFDELASRIPWVKRPNQSPLKFKSDLTFDNDLDLVRKIVANSREETLYAKNSKRQCREDCNRSLQDLHRIALYYKPEMSKTEFLYLFYLVAKRSSLCIKDGKNVYIGGAFYCSDVQKVVINISPLSAYTLSNKIPWYNEFHFLSDYFRKHETLFNYN